MIYLILFFATLFLAYSNGANDNIKGVATLFGSGTTAYRRAIRWATLFTLMGSVSSVFLAGVLIKNFSGKALIPDAILQHPSFAISIALGAGITVFLASKIGMPISTTHSLVGALLGSGLIAVGNDFNFTRLFAIFLLPLLVSPLLALALSALIYPLFKKIRLVFGISKQTCLCLENTLIPLCTCIRKDGSVAFVPVDQFKTDTNQMCEEKYSGQVFGIRAQKLLDDAHYFSAGLLSFSRGLNDTPKILGLLLVFGFADTRILLLVLALAMALGGLLQARKVGETISKKITPMNPGQGFTANIIASVLVATASVNGLPVSTTHVSIGSIFGIGLITRKADKKIIGNILLSWVLTLPVAALFSALVYQIFRLL